MDAPSSETKVVMASVFEKRAARARGLAFGILGVIFLLLAGGAAAFVLAPQITLSDFNSAVDVDKKIDDVVQELNQVNKALDAFVAERRKQASAPWDALNAVLTNYGNKLPVA